VRYQLGYIPEWPARQDWTVRCHPRTLEAFRGATRIPDCRDELEEFVTYCTPGMVLVDVGSHYGVFTLAAARYGGSSARVLAVDASPTCMRLLRVNVTLAGAEGQVTRILAAVGERDGELAMLSSGPNGMDSLIAADPARADAQRVPMLRLPTLAARLDSPVTHIKLDVEGYEAEVVDGAMDYLRAWQPIVFLELHCDQLRARGKDPLAVLTRLGECGYTRFKRAGKPLDASTAAQEPLVRLVCLPERMTKTTQS
jgi:FkbM family methyltransferase